MKKPEENVIRDGGAALGINSWKFNQGGFKGGGSARVRVRGGGGGGVEHCGVFPILGAQVIPTDYSPEVLSSIMTSSPPTRDAHVNGEAAGGSGGRGGGHRQSGALTSEALFCALGSSRSGASRFTCRTAPRRAAVTAVWETTSL